MRSLVIDLLLQKFKKDSPETLQQQLYRLFTDSIRSSQLGTTQRLPSTRELSTMLSISRNTAISVYEQLHAEGFIESKAGSGTFVSPEVPDVYPPEILSHDTTSAPWLSTQISARGQQIINEAPLYSSMPGAFMPGVPDTSLFPQQKFAKYLSAAWKNPSITSLSYAQNGGLMQLREEINRYVAVCRSVQCEPDQIIITEGIHQSIDLVTRMLGNPGDTAWMEDPGYWGARTLFAANGYNIMPLPVDKDGIVLPNNKNISTTPKFIFATPSHQYPLGTVMSLKRRRHLIHTARRMGSWIIEDDYDSEFRFGGSPIPALQGLEANTPVIYMGTFSKTMFPALRLNYMVVPKVLAKTLKKAHTTLYREGRITTQAAVAKFMAQGLYESHILVMRKIYAKRRKILCDVINQRLGADWISQNSDNAGLHLVMQLPTCINDNNLVHIAKQYGLLTRPLSSYYHQAENAKQGLLLGFACVPDDAIVQKFELLMKSINKASHMASTAFKQR